MRSNKNQDESKRSALPHSCEFTKSFVKDWERLNKSGRFNMKQLKTAILLLVANDAPLGPEWLDHPLRENGPITANAILAAISS